MAQPLISELAALAGQVKSMLIEFHLFETYNPYQARTWTARMTDRDANHYAISPPPI